jgi:hypothetical protein
MQSHYVGLALVAVTPSQSSAKQKNNQATGLILLLQGTCVLLLLDHGCAAVDVALGRGRWGHVTEAGKQRSWLSHRRVRSQQESEKGQDCTAGLLGIA